MDNELITDSSLPQGVGGLSCYSSEQATLQRVVYSFRFNLNDSVLFSKIRAYQKFTSFSHRQNLVKGKGGGTGERDRNVYP